nr:MAG: capsid protein [Cressdnaviricota sp.]
MSSKGINKRKLMAAKQAVRKAGNLLRSKGVTASTAMELSTPTNRGGFGQYSKPLPYYRQPELKVVDTTEQTNVLGATGIFTVVNVPQVGAAFYNRIGNEIEMKSLHLIGQIALTGTAPVPQFEYDRVIVVYDRQPNGAFPSASDLLTSYTSSGGTSTTAYDHLNPNNFDRFKVLADIRLAFNWNATAALTDHEAKAKDYKGEYNINRFINLRGLSCKYKASAGTIGDVTTGALLVFTVGTSATANAPYQFVWSARLRFID